MNRKRTWHTDLAALVEERRHAPFVWGTNDCCIWAADAVLAITGQDFAEGLRATYATASQAARVLEQVGGVREVATRVLGHPVGKAWAAPGDVVLVEQGGRELLGVCNGGTVLVVGERGLEFVGIDAALSVWKV